MKSRPKRPSGQAVTLIKGFEGLKLDSYQDIGGVWTIGYGETGQHIGPGLKITAVEAENWLLRRVERLGERILSLVTEDITQNQLDALVSLVYNIGEGAFAHSTLLKRMNQGLPAEAAQEIMKWDHVKGKQIDGLTRRRLAEYRLFVS